MAIHSIEKLHVDEQKKSFIIFTSLATELNHVERQSVSWQDTLEKTFRMGSMSLVMP